MSLINTPWLKSTKNLGNCEEMDKISQLSDELLLKVLQFLPTRTAVSTSILSKRWEFLWMWLPKLEYDNTDQSSSELQRLRAFIHLNLPLHRAPAIEIFRLKFINIPTGIFKPKDIKLWVVIAVSCCVRELSLNLRCMCRATSLPSSLYICKSLVVLNLIGDEISVDVPRTAYLPSLKALLLRRVIYSHLNENSLHRLLSCCPVLEDLVLERWSMDYMGESEIFRTVNVTIPSLRRLALEIPRDVDMDELVVNTPSLKYFKLVTEEDSYSYDFQDMSKLEVADIETTFPDISKFVTSITSVKRLSLCVRVNAEEEEALYSEGIVFNQLENLKLCPCDANWSKLLVRFLENSPNLRELEIDLNDDHKDSCVDPLVCLENQLNYVPECLRSSLETFKWTGIHGSQKEIELVKYIMRNACCLKTATILFQSTTPETEDKRKTMIQELLLSSRSSTTCQLVFD
ncbi:putative F-box/LRR-repeat protein At4g15060 isoform X1 [Arabidopsis lyrata subsp. lyrata]|uniref:putative F-box/LRR-repeat protein At4g15060 isoform X1 n=1 Tax=Arabidopsis lyrata subsp. lyrata TaxID=81972 RepID=UPI000A29E928|nr:putative F-box/LRR-repeat protein At4g15060 isoform X1 [Arabidopsis lyrata subsp. lyrata]|eukprot:XP_020873022.1 putative F-box/LRR-repeat protein At4g15060 isoform X1 [Arabidopsis lyrata subsp. lyrata]